VDEDQPLTPAGTRVLDVAGTLFYREGINTVGVARVAEVAGVTKKTLYDCFGSKDALVTRYLRQRHRRWWDHLEQRLETAPAPRALALFDAYFDHPWLDDGRGCAFLNAAAELGPDHPALEVVRHHKGLVRRRLAELVAETTTADPSIAETLFLALEGATAQLAFGDDSHVAAARRLAVAHLGEPAT
jgi:AcrR family transcriptional regulator